MAIQLIISGQIKQSKMKPLSGVTVRAFDKGLPSLKTSDLDEQQLGDGALTDAQGCYRITYPGDQFRKGESRRQRKLRPDLVAKGLIQDLLVQNQRVETTTVLTNTTTKRRNQNELYD